MKVEGLLNEAGIPTEEHKAALDTKIENAINQFGTDSQGMVTTFMMKLNQLRGKFDECLGGGEDAFTGAWDNGEEGGHKFIL